VIRQADCARAAGLWQTLCARSLPNGNQPASGPLLSQTADVDRTAVGRSWNCWCRGSLGSYHAGPVADSSRSIGEFSQRNCSHVAVTNSSFGPCWSAGRNVPDWRGSAAAGQPGADHLRTGDSFSFAFARQQLLQACGRVAEVGIFVRASRRPVWPLRIQSLSALQSDDRGTGTMK
jgi:hypothetical protein